MMTVATMIKLAVIFVTMFSTTVLGAIVTATTTTMSRSLEVDQRTFFASDDGSGGQSRRARDGDFDEFNRIFENAYILLPEEYPVSKRIAFVDLNANIRNIKCYNIAVNDITISHDRISSTKYQVSIGIDQLDLTCEMDYDYKYGVLNGDGWVQIKTDNNMASSTLQFTSVDFDRAAPNKTAIEQCRATVEIERMDFENDVASEILEVFQGLVHDVVENALGNLACNELGVLGSSIVGNMVELADSHLMPYMGDIEEPDPLYLERNFLDENLPSGLVPLNLQDSGEVVGKVFNYFLDFLDVYLGRTTSDPTRSNVTGEDLAVNDLLRSFVLDKDRGFRVDPTTIPTMDPILFEGHDRVTQFTILLNEVVIYGLDSLSRFNPFRPIGRHTLQNELTWDSLTADFDITVNIQPSSFDDAILNDPTSPGIEEHITVSFTVDQIDVETSLLSVLDAEKLGSMELGPLLYSENILPCLLSVVHEAKLSELNVDPTYINEPTISGFVSPGLDRIITDSVKAAFAMYSGVLRDAIPNIFQSSIRDLINTFINAYRNDIGNTLCPNVAPVGNELIDFQKLFDPKLNFYGDLPPIAKKMLDSELLTVSPDTGRPLINEFVINPFTKAQSGSVGTITFPFNLESVLESDTIRPPKDLFNIETTVNIGALDADVKVRLFDVTLENVDSIGFPIEILGVILGQAYDLNNMATFGVGERPLKLSSKLLFSVNGDDNEIEVGLELSDSTVALSTMLKIVVDRVFALQLSDIFNVNCLLATVADTPALDSYGVRDANIKPSASLSDLDVHVGQLRLSANCTNCSSSTVNEWVHLLDAPEAQNDTAVVANMFLHNVEQRLEGDQSFLQLQIDRLLHDASRKCRDPNAAPTTYEAFEAPEVDYGLSHLLLLAGLAVAAIIIISAIIFVVRLIVRRRHKMWMAMLPPYQLKLLAHRQKLEDIEAHVLNITTQSMFQSHVIPLLTRWMMPIIILCNGALFLSGHLSLSATVNVQAELAGETIKMQNLFEFSVVSSTIDIWKAGGKGLAILIFIFSGVWPYTKLLMTLALWFLPPSSVSISRRGSILHWLDWLAKWSMIDIFVIVISIATFHISIESPNTPYLPEDMYSIELMVIPLWGLYSNMLAQVISQLTSHVIIHYHQEIVAKAAREFSQTALTRSHAQIARMGSEATIGLHEEDFPVAKPMQEFYQETSTTNLAGASNGLDQEAPTGVQPQEIFENEVTAIRVSSVDVPAAKEMSISLNDYRFARPHRGETEKLVVRSFVKKLLPCCAMAIIILVIVGCALPSFSVELFGLVRFAVNIGQDSEEAVSLHSVFSVIKALFDQASYLGTAKDYIGLGVLSMLFLSTLLLVPIIQSIGLLHQWFSITTVSQKKRMAARLEILQAWQYLEVYLLALFVSSWQMGPISDSMINTYCEKFDGIFAQLVYFGILEEEDAQCFSVTSHLQEGAFVLLAGAVVLGFFTSFVLKGALQYLHDYQIEEKEAYAMAYTNEINDHTMADYRPIPVLFTDSFRWLLQVDGSNKDARQ